MTRKMLLSSACALGLARVAMGAAAPASAPAAIAPPTTSPAVAAKAPATGPGPAVEAMKIFVVEVKGLVQVRLSETQPWKTAKPGMELDQGAEFRTGPRSSVTCQIPPDQTIVLDRLGTVKIDEAIRTGTKIKTDMTMKYGRTHYDIEAAGAEHESTIRSPTSTLAVRGTFVSLYDQPPFAPEAESIHGQAEFRNAHRELRFGGKTPTRIASDKNSAADTALARQTVDPSSARSRTRSEARYVTDQTSKSAVFSFDDAASIDVIRNGPPPLTDSQLLAAVPNLPGTLDIVMRWQGNADMNLVVGDQSGKNPISLLTNFSPKELLYPGFGLNHSSLGGTIPYDNRGGPNGGMEIAYWGPNYPQGLYGLEAIHQSGGPALVTFDIFLNGKQLTNLRTLAVDSQGNLLSDPVTGFPTLIKNSQITRPVSSPSNPPSFFGPTSGLASAIAFIPPVPTYQGSAVVKDADGNTIFIADDGVPQETPVSFSPPATGKGGKSRSTQVEKKSTPAAPAVNTFVGPATPSAGINRPAGRGK